MATTTTTILPPPLSDSDKAWASDDKTIVIKAEEVQFQVHTDVLVRCSEVFRDLLTLPQPADAESIEGSPVVRIEGTSAEDMQLLIACISGSTECVALSPLHQPVHTHTDPAVATARCSQTTPASRSCCGIPQSLR